MINYILESKFWDNTFPIILSVGGDYHHVAIKQDSGKVVQGWEHEFEYPSVVADSFVSRIFPINKPNKSIEFLI